MLALLPIITLVLADCPAYSKTVTTGTVGCAAVTEASGMAASRQNSGVLWMHNDSAGAAALYALSASGACLGTYTLAGAANTDWEDMAIGPGPVAGVHYLYIGDIGDNTNSRASIRVYRVAEPAVTLDQPPANETLTGIEMMTLVYPDGPRDAETLMIDTNGDLYIVTKRVSAVGRVYRAVFPQSTTSTITLQFVAQLPWGSVNGLFGATGGDIAPDGSAVIVRRYSGLSPSATLWPRPPGTDLWDVFAQPGCNITMPPRMQGEAVCFAPAGLSLYTVSEGTAQPIYLIPRAPVPGDINGDFVVDVNDLLILVGAWGPCQAPPSECSADVAPPPDGDGVVDVNDLLYLIGAWS